MSISEGVTRTSRCLSRVRLGGCHTYISVPVTRTSRWVSHVRLGACHAYGGHPVQRPVCTPSCARVNAFNACALTAEVTLTRLAGSIPFSKNE